MKKKENKQYPPEFKASAIKLALESDQPVSHTAKDLGISSSTLHTWVSQYTQSSGEGSSKVDEHLHNEVKRLKKENARLKEERDILKKAAAYFAKETR